MRRFAPRSAREKASADDRQRFAILDIGDLFSSPFPLPGTEEEPLF